MRLTHLGLTNFRVYRRLDLTLSPGVTLLVGDNAQGKTALLEAIYYLATSRSPRGSADREMLAWAARDEPLPFSRVTGEVLRADGSVRLEIVTVRPPGEPMGRLEKRVKIDGVTRRALDLLGQVNVVLFAPEDIALLEEGPGVRRRYLDAALCQLDARYCYALGQYRKVVTQRNSLLRRIQDGLARRDEIGVWDELLIEHGALLTARRHAWLRLLAERGDPIHRDLTGGRDPIHINYRPSALFSQSEPLRTPGAAEAAQAVLSRDELPLDTVRVAFRARLAGRAAAEVRAGATLVGPHRDDFLLLSHGVDLHIYGSRGQKRTAALALKLAEAEGMQATTGEAPLLLLDDVMSELDALRRAYVAERMLRHDQTLATATDWSDFSPDLQARATRLTVRGGAVTPA